MRFAPTTTEFSYQAVILAFPPLAAAPAGEEKGKIVDESTTTIKAGKHALSSPSSISTGSSILTFSAGTIIGMICFYYGVHALVFTSLPYMKNHLWRDCVGVALVWSLLTTVVAYNIWCGCIWTNDSHDDNDDVNDDTTDEETATRTGSKAPKTEEEEEEKANCYHLGVFWGFTSACIISLALADQPTIFLLAVICMACIWTSIVSRIGHWEQT